jgi:hypothetical protein
MADFKKLSDEQRKNYDEALSFLEIANSPTPQGAQHRAQLQQMGLPQSKLREVAAYRAWKYGLDKPTEYDPKRLAGLGTDSKTAAAAARQIHEETQARLMGAFDKFAAEEKKPIEMEPEKVTAKTRAKTMLAKRKTKAAMAAAEPIGAQPAAAMPAPRPMPAPMQQPDLAGALEQRSQPPLAMPASRMTIGGMPLQPQRPVFGGRIASADDIMQPEEL